MARDFDGSSGYLSIGDPSRLNITTGNCTIFAWINLDAGPPAVSAGIMARSNTGSPTKLIGLEITTARLLRFELYDGTNNPFANGTTTLDGIGWRAVAGARDSGTLRAYVSGTQEGSASDTAGDVSGASQTWRIGSRPDLFGDYMNGRIAEVAIWSVALTAGEHTALAAGVSPLLIRPASLLGYWPIWGTSSPEIERMAANAGTVTGTAPVSAHPRIAYPVSPAILRQIAAGGASVVGRGLLDGKLLQPRRLVG